MTVRQPLFSSMWCRLRTGRCTAGFAFGGAVRGGTQAWKRLAGKERLQDFQETKDRLEAEAAGACPSRTV